MNWRDYIQHDNPVAAALLCKMDFKEEEKVQVKKEVLRMIVRMELNSARAHLIAGFFDQYLILNEEEEEQLEKEIKSLNKQEAMKVMELKTAWEVKAEERGIEKGIEKGKRDGTISIINRLVQVQFPNHFHEIQEKVQMINDLSFLENLSEKILTTKDYKDIEQWIDYKLELERE